MEAGCRVFEQDAVAQTVVALVTCDRLALITV